jgi:hypothetical protein
MAKELLTDRKVQQAITHNFDNPTVIAGEVRIDDLGSAFFELGERSGLVVTHEATVTRHVGGHDRGKPSLGALFSHRPVRPQDRPIGKLVDVRMSMDDRHERSVLGQRPNVLIHAEEIFWVVLRLNFLQSAIVGAVCGRYWLTRLVIAQVVHIASRGKKWLHLRERFACPGNAPIVIRLIQPFAQYEEL